MGYGVICQACGIEAPSKHVEFHQNIGALVMRFHRKVRGKLCKKCIHANFWKMTGTTLGIGWLGYISVFIAPIFIVNNLYRYLTALGMPAVPPGATKPVVDNGAIERLYPLLPEIGRRIGMKQDLSDIAREMAPQANVTPGQLVVYVAQLAQRGQLQSIVQRPTGGFPVIPTQAPTQLAASLPPPALANA